MNHYFVQIHMNNLVAPDIENSTGRRMVMLEKCNKMVNLSQHWRDIILVFNIDYKIIRIWNYVGSELSFPFQAHIDIWEMQHDKKHT